MGHRDSGSARGVNKASGYLICLRLPCTQSRHSIGGDALGRLRGIDHAEALRLGLRARQYVWRTR